ncbi:tyrosine-protein phosphatase [Kitasatospora sp. NBC_01539]|uniref:tyrosine-protein phosphatase n=1 Tax=Kitasatospora sp. NBC_01539 TaxID=2903577 RepID=UPI0038601765
MSQPLNAAAAAGHPTARPTARRLVTAGLAGALALGTMAGTASVADAATAHPAAAHGPARSAQAIPFTAATVTRQADGSFTVAWSAPGVRHVTVLAGRDPQHIDRRHAVATGRGSDTATITGLGSADRWWFEIVPDHGASLTLADRSLHLASAPNFRDAGGYRTSGGHWVRMGVLYRSGDLARLTDADLATLRRLGIRTDIDLRTASERAASPDRVPTGTTYVVADVLGSGIAGSLPATEAAAVQMMEDVERTMVSSDSGRAAYTTLVGAAADRGAAAVLYHCTAGKDRTGWASAAVLTALGVPRATVNADYLASNTYRAAENAAALQQVPASMRPAYQALLDVRPSYLDAGFAEVTRVYGSFDGYLRTGLGLDARDLRDLRRQLLVG